MHPDQLRAKITALSQWKRGNERASHKPLLLLLALAAVHNDGTRWVGYNAVEPELQKLLEEFGPPRLSTHVNYPFWRLQTDGIWTVRGADRYSRNSSGDVSAGQLRQADAQAGFTDEVYALLKQQPGLAADLANRILEAHFPETLHDDIRQAVGLEDMYEVPEFETVQRRKRDSRFRELVLIAYGYQCAVCGFQLRLGNAPVGLEAAHITWHQAHGPSIVPNGLSLCSLHHKLFDLGVFTVHDELSVEVSELANGAPSIDTYLLPYNHQPLRGLLNPANRPKEEYLAWHRTSVFKGK